MRCSLPACKSGLILLVLSILISVVFSPLTKACAGEKMTDIRVGLVSKYSGKKAITIYNSPVIMGYCVNDSFRAEEMLCSEGGFVFEPETGEWYYSEQEFSSLAEISSFMAKTGVKGIRACSAGRGRWRMLVRASDYLNGKFDGIASVRFQRLKNTSYLIRVTATNFSFLIDGKEAGSFPQFKSQSTVSLGSRSYRGRIEIGRYGGGLSLSAVNIVNLEAYLAGVVTCEMPAGWNFEALKAQAVCARSYAAAVCKFKAGGGIDKGYVLSDTVSSQVYRGCSGETAAGIKAVKATESQVLKSNGSILQAFFYSTSGGSTENISDVWGSISSVFEAVPDLLELRPEKAPWIKTVSFSEITEILNDNGYDIGEVYKVRNAVTTATGRAYLVRFYGSKGNVSISGTAVRTMFGLLSTKFRINDAEADNSMSVTDGNGIRSISPADCYAVLGSGSIKALAGLEQYIAIGESNMSNYPSSAPRKGYIEFAGMGYGHGVGLSQSGANGLAEAGYGYRDILFHYYKNVTLENIY